MGHSRREQQQQGCYRLCCQAEHPPDGSWASVGFSLPPVRFQCKQLGHTWLQQGEAPVSWKQHQLSPAHLYALLCCYHTPSTYPPPVTLSLLPPAALPCPQSQLFYPCLLPSPAIAFCLSTAHTSPVLHSPPALSLSLSSSWISQILFGCILIPHPQHTNSAKHPHLSPT